MNKTIIALTATALGTSFVFVGETRAQVPQATDITSKEIQAALEKTASLPTSDQQLRTVSINGEYNVATALLRRAKTATNLPLVHNQITEVYYILSGNGTFVTGGMMEDSKDAPARGIPIIGPSIVGSRISGGKTRQIGPGDMVIVPPNTPHGFTEITSDQIAYIVVRIDPHKVLQVD